MTQEAENAVRRAQQACDQLLERERAQHVSIEASLRRELAEAKASEARWCERIKQLEARLAQVVAVASGDGAR